ncbi:MAG: hypothetical protein AAFY74_20530 [Pseudomonadota bacterium]
MQGHGPDGFVIISADGTVRPARYVSNTALPVGSAVASRAGGRVIDQQPRYEVPQVNPPIAEAVIDQLLVALGKPIAVTEGLGYDFLIYGPSGVQQIYEYRPDGFFPNDALFFSGAYASGDGIWALSARSATDWILQLGYIDAFEEPPNEQSIFVRGFRMRTIRSSGVVSDLRIDSGFYDGGASISESNRSTPGRFYLANGNAVFSRFATFRDATSLPEEVDDFWYESFTLDGLAGTTANPVARTFKAFNGQGRFEDDIDEISVQGSLYNNISEPIEADSDFSGRTFLSGFITGVGSRFYTHSETGGSTLLEVAAGVNEGLLQSARILTYRHPNIYLLTNENLSTQVASVDRLSIVGQEVAYQETLSIDLVTGIDDIGQRISQLNTPASNRLYVFLPK